MIITTTFAPSECTKRGVFNSGYDSKLSGKGMACVSTAYPEQNHHKNKDVHPEWYRTESLQKCKCVSRMIQVRTTGEMRVKVNATSLHSLISFLQIFVNHGYTAGIKTVLGKSYCCQN